MRQAPDGPFRRHRVRRAIAALVLAGMAISPVAANAELQKVEVSARPISEFRIGSSETRFGPLEFVGGLEMTSPESDFGALSAFRFTSPGGDFVGVADTGFWFYGTVERDGDQRPSGLANFRMEQMVDASGKLIKKKWLVDAEGLDVKDGIATVGFERNHRVSQFKIKPGNMKAAFRDLDFLVPANELRQNRGFETVTRANADGQHEGGLVVVSEKSLDKQGNIFAAIIEGPHKGIFTIKRSGDFDITDGAFLPDGDLLLLERSFTMAVGVKMRLRRIYGEEIAKGEVADGPILFAADMAYQIDNMEAMDVWQRPDGTVMVSLMSDDNHSILQRNLSGHLAAIVLLRGRRQQFEKQAVLHPHLKQGERSAIAFAGDPAYLSADGEHFRLRQRRCDCRMHRKALRRSWRGTRLEHVGADIKLDIVRINLDCRAVSVAEKHDASALNRVERKVLAADQPRDRARDQVRVPGRDGDVEDHGSHSGVRLRS
jgi:hypothetical protein